MRLVIPLRSRSFREIKFSLLLFVRKSGIIGAIDTNTETAANMSNNLALKLGSNLKQVRKVILEKRL